MTETTAEQIHVVPQHPDQALGAQIEVFVKTLPNIQAVERKLVPEEYWLIHILREPDIGDKFRSSLSRAQLTSHNLLEEWISLRITDKPSDLDAKAAMIRAKAEQRESRKDGESSSTPGPQSYHYHLARLFHSEFTPPSELTPPRLYHAILQQQRRDAAVYASCHRIASSYYEQICTVNQDAEDLSIPYINELPFDPCPWLEHHAKDLASLPFYLWDIRKRRTVEVETLISYIGTIPEYVAISHTWGRWADMNSKLVKIDGVPWKILPNTRFSVDDLPNQLEKLPYDYVWLDLLTIPQQELNDEQKQRQKREIARQASIFRSAKVAIAWLNDVTKWANLPTVMQYTSLKFLRESHLQKLDVEKINNLLTQAAKDKSVHTELINAPVGSPSFQTHPQPNSWLTSLWTLQETCLRPDMLLCTKNWDILHLSPGILISLSDIIAMFHVLARMQPQGHLDHTDPAGVVELARLVRDTDLLHLPNQSRLSIITAGNFRHCTERRAEAIMSAIGVTDWFEHNPLNTHEEDLVLELYPLPFVKEIRKKIGSVTFFSATPLGWEFHYVLRKFCSNKRMKKFKFEDLGSLLPFGPGATNITFDLDANMHMDAHTAVENWQIEPNGCVRITSAGIISANNNSQAKIQCILAVPSADTDENQLCILQNHDLNTWLKSYKPFSPNYAVCLTYSALSSRGIILKEMKPGIMLRIGNYWQMEPPSYPMPASQEVDWLVM